MAGITCLDEEVHISKKTIANEFACSQEEYPVANILEPQKIEEILDYTMVVLQESKNQMYDIVETAQSEYKRVALAIEELKVDIAQTIDSVEKLERDFRKVRIHLVEVNRNIGQYSEAERQNAYEEADRVREELAAAREREKNLHKQRNEQEQALKNVSRLVAKAEKSVSQVGVALDFLNGNMDEINEQLEGIQVRYQLGQKIIKMQEDERKRVAREIHDGPAQNLANVVLKAEICERLFANNRMDELMAELEELKQTINASLQETRQIIHNLRPMVLDDLGLVPAVKLLTEDLQKQAEIEVEMTVIGKARRLDSAVEVAIFRIVQEAINNTYKYARATRITIKLEYLTEQVNAAVEDNGIGFDMGSLNDRLTTGEHFGLYGMRERIELLGGSLTIHSNKGIGTRIGIMIPLKRNGE